MESIDNAQVMKQRSDIEQFRVELYLLPDSLHRAKHKHSNRVIEQHLRFVLPHQLSGLPGDLAIGDINARNHVGHYQTPISVCAH